MERVIFCRAGPELLRREVRTTEYVVVNLPDVRATRPRQSTFATNWSAQSRPNIEPFRVSHHLEPGRCGSTDSPVTDAFHRVRARCRRHLRVAFRRRVTAVRHRVTFTLHGCNAKKNLAGKSLRESIDSGNPACNVAQFAAKFPQNPAVSDAVNNLNDCMMLKTKLTTNSHRWLADGRVFSRHTHHRHDAPLPPTMDGGTR